MPNIRLEERYFLLIHAEEFLATHIADLQVFGFVHDENVEDCYLAPRKRPDCETFVKSSAIRMRVLERVLGPRPGRSRQATSKLQAVKRWFYDDWRRIEPKLRTSIVEGISVFLSLFDDNPT